MALNHVCMWTGQRWEQVSVEDLERKGAVRKVSAQSQLFMCELCGQYVTLAHGPQRTYFKHDASVESKECEERSEQQGSGYGFHLTDALPELPLRLEIESPRCFHFEIGLSLPQGLSFAERQDETTLCFMGLCFDDTEGESF